MWRACEGGVKVQCGGSVRKGAGGELFERCATTCSYLK